MTTQEVMKDLMNNNTGGYFYKDNCRINYSSISGWYCKDFVNGKMQTYCIDATEVKNRVNNHLYKQKESRLLTKKEGEIGQTIGKEKRSI